ncbi:alanine racemase [Desulfospira joergensenii]|uniref:alanine racemase n=1 Tax=Desulfospira joergensenii TaxID=53329 RepID=UPI0003B4F2D5|nr:alanine racemase [Desulfospira joergensenii]
MREESAGALLPQTRVHVDRDALAFNVRALKKRCGEGVALMAVVKANAYGHGAVETAKTVLAAGASFLAVARISEAVELRIAGIEAPILLFGDILPDQARYAAANNIRITLVSLDTAKEISRALKGTGCRARVHIKVDTGMGRLGFVPGPDGGPDDLVEEIWAMGELKELEIEGIYTHLASADTGDKAHALEQIHLFSRIREALSKRGLGPLIAHAANSAAVIDMVEAHFDMIRPGISLYGLWPSPEVNRDIVDLKPVMSITSRIIQLKKVPRGFGISYGSTHVTEKPTQIATVPIGYADGYSRLLSSRGSMLVRGIKAPVVGRVCMDFTMIDVGHIPGVRPGDEVVVLGEQGKESVTADEIAGLMQTINYEVVTGFSRRIPIEYGREK